MRRIPWVLIVVGSLWITAVAAGMGLLLDFASIPGASGSAQRFWPRDTSVVRAGGLPALVMIAHPRCPCTRASVSELARIMTRLKGRLAAHVLLVQPEGADADWWKTDIAESAAAIPGVAVMLDHAGENARRFGALTSGHTLLYDGDGRLLFSGGITGARGHAGDNAGHSAVVALVEQRAASPTSSVFGCALHDGRVAANEVLPP